MNVEDFSFSEDDNGVENITYKENPTKKKRKEMKSNVPFHLALTKRPKLPSLKCGI